MEIVWKRKFFWKKIIKKLEIYSESDNLQTKYNKNDIWQKSFGESSFLKIINWFRKW